jgi:hypothetical protein
VSCPDKPKYACFKGAENHSISSIDLIFTGCDEVATWSREALVFSFFFLPFSNFILLSSSLLFFVPFFSLLFSVFDLLGL